MNTTDMLALAERLEAAAQHGSWTTLSGYSSEAAKALRSLAATDGAAEPDAWLRVSPYDPSSNTLAWSVDRLTGADKAEGWREVPLYITPPAPVKAEAGEPVAWQPIETAPKGRDIVVLTKNRAGCHGYLIAHYASDLSGEEQPPFEGWFWWTGFDFRQVPTSDLLKWADLPEAYEEAMRAPPASHAAGYTAGIEAAAK
jgi:hypothetical protein